MECRIVMLGPGGCGKSAITIRYVAGNFVGKYDPTIEDSYRKQVEVDQEPVMLDILDTAGQDEYSALRDQYTKTGHGFMLVFCVDRPETLRLMNMFYTKITRVTQMSRPPVLLIGNKCDLVKERLVERAEATQFARDILRTNYIETSAKTNTNIRNAFHSMVRLVKKHRQTLPAQKNKKSKCTII